jgi:hypothetical protein
VARHRKGKTVERKSFKDFICIDPYKTETLLKEEEENFEAA